MKRENKKPRCKPAPEQAAREGGNRRGIARGGREGITGRRGRGRPPLQQVATATIQGPTEDNKL